MQKIEIQKTNFLVQPNGQASLPEIDNDGTVIYRFQLEAVAIPEAAPKSTS